MAVACEVRRSVAKDPQSVKLEHFKIKFERPKPLTEEAKKSITAIAKARWFAAVGYKPET
jgi:hypothetical protein